MEKKQKKPNGASGSTFLRYLSGVLNPMGLILSAAVIAALTYLLDLAVEATAFTEMLPLVVFLYLCMLLFYTPISFAIEARRNGYRKMDMQSEIGKICTNLNAEAHSISKRVPKKIKFYQESKDDTVNAWCFGSKKVCISKGFADGLRPSAYETEEQKANIEEAAKGVLAHEFGHISNGDMIGEHICVAAMATFSAALYATYLFLFVIVKICCHIPIINLIAALLSYVLNGIYYLARWITGIGYKLFHIVNGKREETNADAFAVRLGHKEGLLNFLENYCLKEFGNGKVLDEHPLTSKRIAALKAKE